MWRYEKISLIFLSLLFFSYTVSANTYLWENSTWDGGLTGAFWTSIALGDVDNDNYLDLAQIGCTGTTGGTRCNGYVSKIYTNNGINFTENSTWQSNLTALHYGSIAWGDVDNDGDLDLVLTGCNKDGGTVSACNGQDSFIYINNGTSFVANSTWKSNITDVWKSSIAFGDIDLDGDLDLVLTGLTSTARIAKIYINDKTGFAENTVWQNSLTAVSDSAIALGDIDNDGDLDLILTGYDGTSSVGKIYINNGSSFVENTTWQQNLLAVIQGAISLGDYNNDGRIDLTLIGHTTHDNHEIYNNTGSTFVKIQEPYGTDQSLIGLFLGTQGFGDYDSDGDLDLFTSGEEEYSTLYLYNVSSSRFTHYLNDPETGIFNSAFGPSAAWGDVDKDDKLDLILVGWDQDNQVNLRAYVYLNNITTKNTKPNPPTNFSSSYQNSQLTLTWSNASDTETTALGLYYNLKVGNSSNKHSIVSGVYGGGDDNGYFGNMMQRRSLTLRNLALQPNQTIYWSVQTIDTSLANGSWSIEQNYTVPQDTDDPVIILNSPADNFNTSNPTITFNALVYDLINLTNVTLYGNWSGTLTKNETNSSGINNTNYIFTKDLTVYGDGYYSWLIEARDNSNNSVNSSARTFRIDTIYPKINLTSPVNASTWTSSSTVTFTYNVTDADAANCSLILNDVVDQTDTSVTVNIAQTFSKSLSNGNYNWSINCTDYVGYQNSSVTRTLTVSYTAPGDGGGSGGGGGGGGGGGTAASSETQSTGTINPGETKTISFTKDFSITDIEVTAKETISDTIKVEDITSSPSVPSAPVNPAQGAVYKYLSLTASKVSAALEKAVINFKVTKSWVTYNKFDENTIELKRLVGAAWESLLTKKISADSNYVYYSAETSGFSKFAIVGKKKIELKRVVKEEAKEPEINVSPQNLTEEITKENLTQEPEEEKVSLVGRVFGFLKSLKEKPIPSEKYTLLVALVVLFGFIYLLLYKIKLHKKK